MALLASLLLLLFVYNHNILLDVIMKLAKVAWANISIPLKCIALYAVFHEIKI